MDKKSKILLWVFGLLIVGSVGVTYWRIMIKKDYIIEAQADCDPTIEKCFVQHCDESAGECTGNPDEDTTYFKKAQRVAANIPLCDPNDENCKPFECKEGEKDCVVSECDEQTKGADDECNDPVQYIAAHPAEEEESTEAGDGATCDSETDDSCKVAKSDDSESADASEGTQDEGGSDTETTKTASN